MRLDHNFTPVVSSSKHYRLQDIQLALPARLGASADKTWESIPRHALSKDARLHAMPLGMLGPQTCALETAHAVQGSVPGFPVPAANKFPGGHRGGVTPVPIPNTEVKPSTADGTAGAGLWESRSLPGIFRSPTRRHDASGFFFSNRSIMPKLDARDRPAASRPTRSRT